MIRNIRGIGKHVFAALLFCLVISIAMVCLADEKGTVTVESAKIRERADTTSNQLGSVAKGGTVDIVGETTGTDGKLWYQVFVDADTKGYIRADLISKSGSSSGANTSSSTNAGASLTQTDARAASVVKNGARVRESASTSSREVATVSRGIVMTVTGETTGADGQKWYQVTFKHSDKDINGFIRSDLVTFDNVPADTAVSEITGENAEGQTEPETEPKEEEPPKQQNNSDDEYAGIIFMNVDGVPYVMPGFELVTLDWNNQKINAYRNGAFYIVYAQKQNGEEGWYLLDKELGVYQRYPYTTGNVTVPNAVSLSGNLVPLIALGAVIVIMGIIIIVLIVKLKGSGDFYEEYDDNDSDEDDDIEDIEDLDDDPAPQPMRRSMPQSGIREPARRPSPQRQGEQPPRRPLPQGQGGQPQGQRRPNPQGQNGQPQGQGGGQLPRRPLPQGQGEQLPRRPSPQGQRRPNPQSSRPPQNAQPPRGQKAKGMLDNDEDDMDFIDI